MEPLSFSFSLNVMIMHRRPGDGAHPPLRGVVGWMVAFWISLSIVDVHKDWLAYRLAGQPITLVTSLVDQVPWWGVWILLAPVVALLAWRFPPVGSRWKVRLPIQVVAGILVAGAQVLLSSLLFELRSGEIRWEPLSDRMTPGENLGFDAIGIGDVTDDGIADFLISGGISSTSPGRIHVVSGVGFN